jgi:hypothetical protein
MGASISTNTLPTLFVGPLMDFPHPSQTIFCQIICNKHLKGPCATHLLCWCLRAFFGHALITFQFTWMIWSHGKLFNIRCSSYDNHSLHASIAIIGPTRVIRKVPQRGMTTWVQSFFDKFSIHRPLNRQLSNPYMKVGWNFMTCYFHLLTLRGYRYLK